MESHSSNTSTAHVLPASSLGGLDVKCNLDVMLCPCNPALHSVQPARSSSAWVTEDLPQPCLEIKKYKNKGLGMQFSEMALVSIYSAVVPTGTV